MLPFVLRLVNAAKQVNKKLETFVVLNKAPTNTKSTEIDKGKAFELYGKKGKNGALLIKTKNK